jgi:hypothetical protein
VNRRTIVWLALTGVALLASPSRAGSPASGPATADVPTLVRVDPGLLPAGEEAALVLVDAATGRRIRTFRPRAARERVWRIRARVVDARSRPSPRRARGRLWVLGTRPVGAVADRAHGPVPGRLHAGRLVILGAADHPRDRFPR